MGLNSFTLVCVAILGAILLSQGAVEARGIVGASPFCRNAKFVELCNRLVAGATSPADASLKVLTATHAVASRLPALKAQITDAINLAYGPPESKADVIKQCNDDIDSAVDNVELSLAAVQAQDSFTAAVKMSATDFSVCTDAMQEIGALFPKSKLANNFKRHVSSSLAVVQTQ